MIYLNGHFAFWVFTFILIGFLTMAIIAARLMSAKKPNKIKNTIYECGQAPFSNARDSKILGITRYFGYAVLFFVLDAFGWVILTAAISISLDLASLLYVSVYLLVVMFGIFYFLIELKKMV